MVCSFRCFAEILNGLRRGWRRKLIRPALFALSLLSPPPNFGCSPSTSVYFPAAALHGLGAFLVRSCWPLSFSWPASPFSWKLALPEQLAMIISLSQVNNVLVLVFSSQLFGRSSLWWRPCTASCSFLCLRDSRLSEMALNGERKLKVASRVDSRRLGSVILSEPGSRQACSWLVGERSEGSAVLSQNTVPSLAQDFGSG